MHTFVIVIHIILCLFLIGVVLLQSGKSDMGSAFGGGGSQAVLTPASGTTLLGKITAGAACFFMITSMSLAYISNSSIRGESVIQGDILDELDDDAKGDTAEDVAPAVPAAPEAAEPAALPDQPAGGAGDAPSGDMAAPAGDDGAPAGDSAPAGDELPPSDDGAAPAGDDAQDAGDE